MPQFFISHCKKIIGDFLFLFLKIYDSARFKYMFQNSVLGCSLMTQRAHRIFNCSNISYTVRDIKSNVKKIWNKHGNALLEKIWSHFFNIFLIFFYSHIKTFNQKSFENI